MWRVITVLREYIRRKDEAIADLAFLNRTLRRFASLGLIETGRGHITILRPEELVGRAG